MVIRQNYTNLIICDHEFNPDACIPLKKTMDNSIRNFLTKIEALENAYLCNGAISYSLEQIKIDLLSIIQDKDFQNAKPLAALCGYIFNTVLPKEQEAVWEFFKENCKVDFIQETDLLTSLNKINLQQKALPKEILPISTLANYRKQLFGSGNLDSSSGIVEDVSRKSNLKNKN